MVTKVKSWHSSKVNRKVYVAMKWAKRANSAWPFGFDKHTHTHTKRDFETS